MGLEQLADVSRAMEQHHNTLWDVHLRQTLCDAKHLFQSCQRKFIDFSFCFWTRIHCGIWERNNYQTTPSTEASQQPILKKIIIIKQINQLTRSFFSNSQLMQPSPDILANWVKLGKQEALSSSSDMKLSTVALRLPPCLNYFLFLSLFSASSRAFVFMLWQSV